VQYAVPTISSTFDNNNNEIDFTGDTVVEMYSYSAHIARVPREAQWSSDRRGWLCPAHIPNADDSLQSPSDERC